MARIYWFGTAKSDGSTKDPKVRKHGVAAFGQAQVRTRSARRAVCRALSPQRTECEVRSAQSAVAMIWASGCQRGVPAPATRAQSPAAQHSPSQPRNARDARGRRGGVRRDRALHPTAQLSTGPADLLLPHCHVLRGSVA